MNVKNRKVVFVARRSKTVNPMMITEMLQVSYIAISVERQYWKRGSRGSWRTSNIVRDRSRVKLLRRKAHSIRSLGNTTVRSSGQRK